MKKLLILLVFLCAGKVFAQKRSLNVDSLIKNKSFTFIVTDISKKPGLNGSYGFSSSNYSSYYNVNPSVMTPRQSLNITNKSLLENGIFVQQEYYRLSQLDGSYFTAFNIDNKNKKLISNDGYAVFLIQDNDKISLNGAQDPNSIDKIKASNFYSLSTINYDITPEKKKNKKWLIRYDLKYKDNKQTFYLDIDQTGKASLTQNPQKDFTTVLNGYIVP